MRTITVNSICLSYKLINFLLMQRKLSRLNSQLLKHYFRANHSSDFDMSYLN